MLKKLTGSSLELFSSLSAPKKPTAYTYAFLDESIGVKKPKKKNKPHFMNKNVKFNALGKQKRRF